MTKTPGHDGAYEKHLGFRRNFTDADDAAHYEAVMDGLARDGYVFTRDQRKAVTETLAIPSNLAALHRLAVVVGDAVTLMEAAPADKKERCHVTIHGVDLLYIHHALALALNAATRRAEANELEGELPDDG